MHTFLIPIIAFLQRSPGPQAMAITASVQIDLGLTTTRHVFRQLNSLQKHFILLATWAISNYQAVVVAPVNANRQMSSSPINHSGTMTACLPGSILIVKPYNECWPKRILARARRLPIRSRTGLNRFLPGNYTADRAACAPEILAGAGRQVKVDLDFIDVCFVSRHFLTIGEVELVRVGSRDTATSPSSAPAIWHRHAFDCVRRPDTSWRSGAWDRRRPLSAPSPERDHRKRAPRSPCRDTS